MCIYCGHPARDPRHDAARDLSHRPVVMREPEDEDRTVEITRAPRGRHAPPPASYPCDLEHPHQTDVARLRCVGRRMQIAYLSRGPAGGASD